MHPRITRILHVLLHTESPVKGDFIAKELEVTSRTVRSDIRLLDDLISSHGARIKAVRGSGYKLHLIDPLTFENWLEKQQLKSSLVPFVPSERITHIIRKLLSRDNYIKLEELSDSLYVSKSTIQNDMKSVREKMTAYGINIVIKPNYGLKLAGEEHQLRFCLSEYLWSSYRENSHNCSNIGEDIADLSELNLIRTIVIGSIKSSGILLSDPGLNNLVIHIAIAVGRIRQGHHITSLPEEVFPLSNSREANVAQSIAELLGSYIVTFPELEIMYLTMHLLGAEQLIELDANGQQIISGLDEECLNYAHAMVEEIEFRLKLGIRSDTELIRSLGLHLKHALNRIRYNMTIRNPMLESIKSTYPLAFQAGIIGATVLQRKLRLLIPEHEIGYIAVHICTALERLKDRNESKTCILVCSSGQGSARLLYQKISKEFGTELKVAGIFGFYNLDQAPINQIDFVISTVPLGSELPVPILVVSPFLRDRDLRHIHYHLNGQKNLSFRFIREDFTFLKIDLDNKEDVLAFICAKIQSKMELTADLLESVNQREAISPTTYGNLTAIPHPIVPLSQETFWAICTLQKPIPWGDKPVQFVCLLCVSPNQEDLSPMYDLLIDVTESPKLVEQLVQAESYEKLANIFFLRQKEKG